MQHSTSFVIVSLSYNDMVNHVYPTDFVQLFPCRLCNPQQIPVYLAALQAYVVKNKLYLGAKRGD